MLAIRSNIIIFIFTTTHKLFISAVLIRKQSSYLFHRHTARYQAQLSSFVSSTSSSKAKKFVSMDSKLGIDPISSIDIKHEPRRWIDLHIPAEELRPNLTLRMGQCFNWRKLDAVDKHNQSNTSNISSIWIGVLESHAIAIRQTIVSTEYQLLPSHIKSEDAVDMTSYLRDYFEVKYSLKELYHTWSESCPRMQVICSHLPGVRVVSQDPWECLVSFICSSCNNIKRITQMLETLRMKYGSYICTVNMTHDQVTTSFSKDNHSDKDGVKLYSFPGPDIIAGVSEEELRGLGFGYRAKFLVNTAILLQSKPGGARAWLSQLRSIAIPDSTPTISPDQAIANLAIIEERLMECPGIGRKVADCIALFSLDCHDAIPVDTHVWEIAIRDYAPHLQLSKSLTPRIYTEVGDVFRHKFIHKAGWAHSVLFAAELPEFRKLLPNDAQLLMKEFADDRKRKRKEQKIERTSPKKNSISSPSSSIS